ncbi:MAG: HEAT repeat domain-containing protein [Ignavibacterium album]|nr:HEAT repeat domain-containing protein [Ignavibacterium album]MBI5662661.1 HEAT repeat domain-containing protein [Ignavibacterium album]
MTNTKISIDELDAIFQSDDVAAQIEFLDQLECAEYDHIVASHLCSYLRKKDKGLRSVLTHFFLNRKCYHVTDKLTEFISSDDISLRNIAGEILISYGEFAVDSLIKFLKKTDNIIDLKFAADILAEIHDKKVEKVVLELIQKTENENVLISYIEALGNNRSVQSVDLLISLYHKSEILKPYIIDSLGKIGTIKAFDFILQQYNDQDDLVKYMIIESLGNIGNEESFYFLLGELQNAKYPFIPPILESIYKLHIRYGLDIPFDEKVKRALLVMLAHKENEYRKIAAKLLSEFDDDEIISEALKHYGQDDEYDGIIYHKLLLNKELVLKQITCLIRNDVPNVSGLLKLIDELLQHDPDFLKNFNEIDLHNLLDAISRCLKHSDEIVRLYAVELLFKIDSETAILLLDNEFLNENFWIKIRLTELLEEINDANAVPFLEKLTEDENEMVSQRAKEILIIKKNIN